MNIRKFFFLAAFAATFGLFFSSCTENTTNPDPDPQPKPSPVSNLKALSVSATEIRVTFNASPSETNSLFKDYEVALSPGAFAPQFVPKGTNMITISNLQEGTVYTVSIAARYTNDSVSSPVSIQWSPATRFTENAAEFPIKIYETASEFGSGLQMYYPTDNAPRVRKVANGGDWDLGIDTRNGKFIFGSASKIDYNYTGTPQKVQIFESYFEADSLNGLYDSEAMNAGARDGKYTEKTFDLTSVSVNKNLVFYVRKYEPGQTRYNYAKVMIRKNPSAAGYLFDAAPNRYIEVHISYQKKVDVPYAKVADNGNSK